MKEELTYDEMQVGDTTTFGKTISESDVYAFAGITGDFNPMHVNEQIAKESMFKGRIAHGMISAGIISTTMTKAMHGGTPIYCSQELKFKAPVRMATRLPARQRLSKKFLKNTVSF